MEYILFIILGILIFFYLNYKETFSIGAPTLEEILRRLLQCIQQYSEPYLISGLQVITIEGNRINIGNVFRINLDDLHLRLYGSPYTVQTIYDEDQFTTQRFIETIQMTGIVTNQAIGILVDIPRAGIANVQIYTQQDIDNMRLYTGTELTGAQQRLAIATGIIDESNNPIYDLPDDILNNILAYLPRQMPPTLTIPSPIQIGIRHIGNIVNPHNILCIIHLYQTLIRRHSECAAPLEEITDT